MNEGRSNKNPWDFDIHDAIYDAAKNVGNKKTAAAWLALAIHKGFRSKPSKLLAQDLIKYLKINWINKWKVSYAEKRKEGEIERTELTCMGLKIDFNSHE